MGTGSGTEGGQSLIKTVPTGACLHFHDSRVMERCYGPHAAGVSFQSDI